MLTDSTRPHDRPPDPIHDDLRQELDAVAAVARSSLAWLAERQRTRRPVGIDELQDYQEALRSSLDEATSIVRAIMDSSSVCPFCRPGRAPCNVAQLATGPRIGPRPARPEPRWRRWRSKP